MNRKPMKKTLILWASFLFYSLATDAPVMSQGACPQGTFPAGGGYCRSIYCRDLPKREAQLAFMLGGAGAAFGDQSAAATLEKNGMSCQGWQGAYWGDQYIPMR